MKYVYKYKILILTLIIGILSCSRKKNTFTRRAYHNTTSRYNAYFNAREIKKSNLKQLRLNYKDDYSEILPLFIYPDEAKSKSMYPAMDKIIEKASKVIDKHSIYIKKKEYNKWVDDSYMLIGEARFYKQEYYVGIDIFEFVAKAFKTNPIKTEALIWLARSHMELKEMAKAETYLALIEEKGFAKEYNSEYNALYAEFFIRKNNYDEAIVKLEKALETTRKKIDRQRYTYVLAQLWLKKKEYGQASDLFTKVIKLRPAYDLMFNAKINRALSYDVQSNDKEDIKKMLAKMVKDKKNVDYLDQIYFALADIAFKEEKEPLGIAYLKKSVASSKSNGKQKAMSYLRLGEYYYKQPLYIPAQAYYDSCLAVLPKNHKNYDEIYERTKALTKLVFNILIVQKEDSLQRMAKDKEFRRKTINKLVQDVLDEEEQKKLDEGVNNSVLPTNSNNSNKAGNWYFYNQITLGFGFSDFKKNWGNRKLEDDWRRSDKQIVATFDESFDEKTDSTTTDSTKNEFKKTDAEYYEQFLPLTAKKINTSNNKIIEALYSLGNIYRENFEDYPNSTKAFKDLITRFDTCKYVLPSWYNLYRISLLTDDDVMKEKYKKLILDNYPESEYAKIIQDPTYNKVARENRKRVNNYYRIIYDLYADHYYKKVILRCNKAKSIFADNHLQDRFDFLAALSIGYTNTVDTFKIALQSIIKNYPKSKVKGEAQKILDYINKKPKILPNTKVAYTYNKDSKFMFMLVLPSSDKKVNKYKIDILNFNAKYYRNAKFEPIKSVVLNGLNQVILIKEFQGERKAMDYYKSFTLNKDNLKELNTKKFQSFIISVKNFVLFYKDKNVKTYYDFFKTNFKVNN